MPPADFVPELPGLERLRDGETWQACCSDHDVRVSARYRVCGGAPAEASISARVHWAHRVSRRGKHRDRVPARARPAYRADAPWRCTASGPSRLASRAEVAPPARRGFGAIGGGIEHREREVEAATQRRASGGRAARSAAVAASPPAVWRRTARAPATGSRSCFQAGADRDPPARRRRPRRRQPRSSEVSARDLAGRGRRRPPRAASCSPGGWHRAGQCKPPRRRPTARCWCAAGIHHQPAHGSAPRPSP
jgi:hypothetical protein